MNDYLWDKTGEPEAEVERLELLLGALRHEPRPLGLPGDTARDETRRQVSFLAGRRTWASRIYAPAGLAAAAGLLLALMLGATLYLRPRTAEEGARASSRRAEPPQPTRAADVPVAAPAEGFTERHAPEVAAGAEQSKQETAAVRNSTPALRRALNVSATHARKSRPKSAPPAPNGGRDGGLAFEALSAGGAPSLVENTRLLAKEQLVYALRLTGAQLRDVRLRAQGFDEQSSPKKRERNR